MTAPGLTTPGVTTPGAPTPGVTTAAPGSGACTPAQAAAGAPKASATSGGAGMSPVAVTPPGPVLPCAHPTVAGFTAEIIHGVAYAPSEAPVQVQRAIWAGNRIRLKPYRVGGGHGKWNDTAYDCSGSVSYLLHAARLLKVSEDSGEMMSWGRGGAGQWITVYTNPGHAFIQIAGIRFDTSAEQDPNPPPGSGPRWRPVMTSTAGFVARHPAGL